MLDILVKLAYHRMPQRFYDESSIDCLRILAAAKLIKISLERSLCASVIEVTPQGRMVVLRRKMDATRDVDRLLCVSWPRWAHPCKGNCPTSRT